MHRIPLIEEKILHIQGAPVRVQKKMIRSLRLRLIPPHGEIRLSVPHWYSDRKAEQFILSRWEWIREQQRTIDAVHPLARQHYEEGETILFRGSPYTLKIKEAERGSVKIEGETIVLREKRDSPRKKRMEDWYRREMKREIDPLVRKHSRRMAVNPSQWRIRKMSSRWGSCNTAARRIWLNLELITMRPEILEYVIVHELAHLLEASHNSHFKSILDHYLPEWRELSRELRDGRKL